MIGGGLLGLECAKALRDMNLATHVVEFAPRLMAVQVDDGGSRVLRRKIEQLGVTVHTQKNTLEIVDGEQGARGGIVIDNSCLTSDPDIYHFAKARPALARVAGQPVRQGRIVATGPGRFAEWAGAGKRCGCGTDRVFLLRRGPQHDLQCYPEKSADHGRVGHRVRQGGR